MKTGSVPVAADCLKLDAHNPRIREYLTDEASETNLLDVLVEHFAIDELVSSILEIGYWQLEPMIVMGDDCEFVVLEGNRRLAAIKILRSPELMRKYGVTAPVDGHLERAIETTNEIACFGVATRYEQWHLIGFKHVNGPQKWDSIAKAAYIYELKQNGVTTDDVAKQLGDKNRTVERLLRAYSVLLQAEESKTWNRNFREKNRLYFSHLMTGLEYKEISEFIELDEAPTDSSTPIAKRPDHLAELLVWLYGDKRSGTKAVVQSQNPDLGSLRRALSTASGAQELRRTGRLDYALDASRGDPEILQEALQQAKFGLERAISKISSGFMGEEEVVRTCILLSELSENLLSAARRRRRILQEGPTEPQ
jgi:hypothetical protein